MRRVVVTGLGVVSSIGVNAEEVTASLRDARSGIVFAPDAAARQVYVVDLVGAERLASAVGLYEIILNTSRVAGPAIGGALLATVGVTPHARRARVGAVALAV